MNFILIWQAPIVFFQKWCPSLFSIVMIQLQVRVLRLAKMHDYLNVPPCIICTPCIIWFWHCTSQIFGLWAFRKFILLCVSNVHNKEHAPLKQSRCIFPLYFGVKHFFWPICDLWPRETFDLLAAFDILDHATICVRLQQNSIVTLMKRLTVLIHTYIQEIPCYHQWYWLWRYSFFYEGTQSYLWYS